MSSTDRDAIDAMRLRLGTLWERNQEWHEAQESWRRDMLAERRRDEFKVVPDEKDGG